MASSRLLLLSSWWLVSSACFGCTETVAMCVPGETRDCSCAGGRPGAQVCADDGRRYEACECSDPGVDAAVADVPTFDAPDAIATDAPVVPDAPRSTCATMPSSLPAGWVRGALTQMTELPQIERVGVFCNPFPNCGGTARILTADDEYQAIRIDTPSDRGSWSAPLQLLQWDRSQVGGAADVVYISISECPGDFRIPVDDAPAPAGDATFARGCRSFRRRAGFPAQPQSTISYIVSDEPSTAEICHLTTGRTYYINFIRADASDGSIGTPDEEALCFGAGLTTCGVQMRIE